MLIDDDEKILVNTGARFIEEMEQELTSLVSVVGSEIRAAGVTVYKSITFVYWDYGPKFIAVNFERDWTYNIVMTDKENTNRLILYIVEVIRKYGVSSSWGQLSVYKGDSYLGKMLK